MAKLYSTGKGDLDWCADAVDDMRDVKSFNLGFGPMLGVNVQVSCVISGSPRPDVQDTKMSKRQIMR